MGIVGRQLKVLKWGGGSEFTTTKGSVTWKELLHASYSCLTRPRLLKEMDTPYLATNLKLTLQACLCLAMMTVNLRLILSTVLWTQKGLQLIPWTKAQVDQEMDLKVIFKGKQSLRYSVLSNYILRLYKRMLPLSYTKMTFSPSMLMPSIILDLRITC
jgi:hypothetical protein